MSKRASVANKYLPLGLLALTTRYLFFTGKGGVGKTSLACATALAFTDAGKSVLLVSTDRASNLDEILSVVLSDRPTPVRGASGLSVLNIDPAVAAEAYRARVLAQLESTVTVEERANILEQLSGACTTEIAAFDEFVGFLADDGVPFDHVIFDTAPTGHTIRLLSLPKAWTGFLEGNDRGASCLGPHSGLKMQEARFKAALEALGDSASTTIVLVTRPENAAIAEAARSSTELRELGIVNQRLIVNGVFRATDSTDPVAVSLEKEGLRALAEMPASLRTLARDEVPLRSYDMVGLEALRTLFRDDPPEIVTRPNANNLSVASNIPGLNRMIDELSAAKHGLIMVMGKGGVGKTTIAAALAIGLVKRGHDVHLSTTDPAAHLAMTLNGELRGLRVDRIDPKAETERYVERIMSTRGRDLNEEERALLREDLRSPCTEEIAVFHAFSRIVSEARAGFVVLDTAPTGHTLLLMDATGAYHRQMVRDLRSLNETGRVVTPLMRLQDPTYTRVLLVTLPETTPVIQAAELQDELRRANIEPYAWIINRSLIAAGTHDPLLKQRLLGEAAKIERVQTSLAKRVFIVPWLVRPPVGLEGLAILAA